MNTIARNLGDDRRPKRRYQDSRWALPERIELCRSLYIDQGVSASKTALQLGPGFTRNMVISLGHREGWKRSPEIAKANAARSVAATSAAKPRRPRLSTPRAAEIGTGHVRTPREPKPAPPPKITPYEVPLTAKPWEQRARVGECAWPIEVNGETWSCCAPVGHDSPAWAYCIGHRNLLVRRYDTARQKPASAVDLERSLRRFTA